MEYLSIDQIKRLFAALSLKDELEIYRIRPHNKSEIKRRETIEISNLIKEIESAIEDDHIFGGDLEVPLPNSEFNLIGHHDGLFWLEKKN